MSTDRRPMSAQDALWLTMDRPNNLMVIDGVMLLRGRPDWDAVLAVARERVLDRFPVFGSRPVHTDDGWAWEPDPNFDIDRHLRRDTLPGPGSVTELADYLSSLRSRPLERDRPMWELTLIDDVVLPTGEPGAALVARFHHAIADGVRLTMVMLSMCDAEDAGVEATVARGDGHHSNGILGMAGTLADLAVSTVRDGLSAVATTAQSVLQAGPAAVTAGVGMGLDLLRHPAHVVDVLDLIDVNNRLLNDATSVTKLALRGRTASTVWSGTPTSTKRIMWSDLMSLPDIKAVAKANGASVNDVLLAAVAGGVRTYLRDRGDDTTQEIEWMVPVNLVPIADNLPEDLGNFFALALVVLPLEPDDPIERLHAVTAHMQRIKNSDEPLITFGVQRGISASPRAIAVALTDFFANKTVGVLTNVPGPRSPMTFAGVPVEQVVGFAPSSGDQPMTVSIFSYAGTVTVGFAVDAELVPDPAELVANTVAEIEALVATLA